MNEASSKRVEKVNKHHKLLITIVKKGLATKVVKATKDAGAEGGTILFGKGQGIHNKKKFLGMSIGSEREIILTLFPHEKIDAILLAVEQSGQLTKPSRGIGFVIDVKKLIGVPHLVGEENEQVEVAMERSIQYDLIVTIVNKGHSDQVVEVSKKAGAEGGTIIHGRGTGIHEQAMLFSIPIEPEKDIVLTLIDRTLTEKVLHAINVEADLQKPGKGIAFVLDVERTIGINHVLNRMVNEEFNK
ncbi:P-II family nitrogen regulator [Bacillus sp. B15-48]|uniref:P-II family nitrogen regulator n=1 Tax=Bacillus sp. B15-48 TaxID=1548601 RepID=UPI00193F572D|nr:P-II family nitrogen regulator [Bacillus sp. B15-48]MBM4760988.1 PII family protein [Bacillus sp. B15-48]